jgi:hypothetical protein
MVVILPDTRRIASAVSAYGTTHNAKKQPNRHVRRGTKTGSVVESVI